MTKWERVQEINKQIEELGVAINELYIERERLTAELNQEMQQKLMGYSKKAVSEYT